MSTEIGSTDGVSTTERVESYVRNGILSGMFKPRQKITEQGLADALQCSRGPIREAILRLGRDGIVETLPRVGTFIPNISLDTIELDFSMRGKLEGLSVRYMRGTMTPEKEEQLTNILEKMRTATRKKDEDGFLQADLSLHRAVWQLSERPQLERTLATVVNPRIVLIARMFSRMIPFSVKLQHHEKYLDIVLHSPRLKVEAQVERHFADVYEEVFGNNCVKQIIAGL